VDDLAKAVTGPDPASTVRELQGPAQDMQQRQANPGARRTDRRHGSDGRRDGDTVTISDGSAREEQRQQDEEGEPDEQDEREKPRAKTAARRQGIDLQA